MIIKKNKDLLNKLHELFRINEENMALGNLLFNAFIDLPETEINKIKKLIEKGKDEKEAILEILYEYLEISDDEEAIAFVKNRIFKDLNKQDGDYFKNNHYASFINKTGKFKDCSLEYLSYKPYQMFSLDDIYIDGYVEHNRIGYFAEEYQYLALLKKKEIWMSLNPNEITTMAPYIDKANGHVLVLGLGMGYVAFMMAMKSNVISVTIVEKDPQVINIFNNLIWPNFKNKEKIEIINDDAIHYLSAKQKAYDYIFADLWHSPDDGLPLFIKIKRINRNIDCWLETSMYALLRRCMITLLFEVLNGYLEKNYLKAKIYTDEVINKYYFTTKKVTIETVDDLDNLLSFDNLLNLMIN